MPTNRFLLLPRLRIFLFVRSYRLLYPPVGYLIISFTMFKAIAILASLVSVAAFTPACLSSGRSASLKTGFEEAPGVRPPDGFFDPLGLPKNIDQQKCDQYRTPSISAALVRYIADRRKSFALGTHRSWRRIHCG